MNRSVNALRILSEAYVKGNLIPGRYSTCVVSTLLKAHGHNDLGWIPMLRSYQEGTDRTFEEVARKTGYSADELLALEDAFEEPVSSNKQRLRNLIMAISRLSQGSFDRKPYAVV